MKTTHTHTQFALRCGWAVEVWVRAPPWMLSRWHAGARAAHAAGRYRVHFLDPLPAAAVAAAALLTTPVALS